MRLDHLLSRELSVGVVLLGARGLSWVLVCGGAAWTGFLHSWCWGLGTLSGSGAVRPVAWPSSALPFLGGGCGVGVVGCELYSGREHLCSLFCCFVCFLERPVDALAPGADEGRGGLRYSSGSRLTGCDPRVSEWGDPAPVVGCHSCLN